MSPLQARNAIKKCLQAIIDRKPSKANIDQLWRFFGEQCAYYGQVVDRASRQGHGDHLIAETDGGSNRLANLVLSCAACNGDEKRDSDWEDFLASKCQSEVLKERRNNIRRWVELNGGSTTLSQAEQHLLKSAYDRVNSILTECITELREFRSQHDQLPR